MKPIKWLIWLCACCHGVVYCLSVLGRVIGLSDEFLNVISYLESPMCEMGSHRTLLNKQASKTNASLSNKWYMWTNYIIFYKQLWLTLILPHLNGQVTVFTGSSELFNMPVNICHRQATAALLSPTDHILQSCQHSLQFRVQVTTGIWNKTECVRLALQKRLPLHLSNGIREEEEGCRPTDSNFPWKY